MDYDLLVGGGREGVDAVLTMWTMTCWLVVGGRVLMLTSPCGL